MSRVACPSPSVCLSIKPPRLVVLGGSSRLKPLALLAWPWPNNKLSELATMRTPAGFLHSAIADAPSPAASLPLLLPAHAEEQQQQAISVDSDTVVILASLLCALICVAGLALVARCACRRGGGASVSVAANGGGGGGNSSGGRSSAQPPRGLEKAAIEALPTVSVSSSLKVKGRTREDDKECAICLAAFAEGDQLRVLPRCAHGFHAACIDTWLAAHASCPSCRATIVSIVSPPPPLCRRCGAACCDLQDAMAAPEPAAAAGLLTPWPIDGASLSSSTSIH